MRSGRRASIAEPLADIRKRDLRLGRLERAADHGRLRQVLLYEFVQRRIQRFEVPALPLSPREHQNPDAEIASLCGADKPRYERWIAKRMPHDQNMAGLLQHVSFEDIPEIPSGLLRRILVGIGIQERRTSEAWIRRLIGRLTRDSAVCPSVLTHGTMKVQQRRTLPRRFDFLGLEDLRFPGLSAESEIRIFTMTAAMGISP